MNERIKELALQSGLVRCGDWGMERWEGPRYDSVGDQDLEKFAELIIRECVEQVELAKNSPFVSLDDANRMKHFVDVTKKKIQKHFGVPE